ncbi:MAG TPA: hypothetical protein DCM28_14780 [Phycisphaerales bacterium]|nr:hypothetical protein [Phycisphaerales bacterium]|tara:strand:+ start:5645 stop:6088 length:444 start_codon:yes stop_codon:yes gene_type:complete
MNQQDKDHLRILAIFYYIAAGFYALLSLLPIVFIVMGVSAIGIGVSQNHGAEASIPGGLIILFGILFMVFILGFAYLYFLTGKFLNQQTHWIYCIIIAALTATSFPLGTILGVFTIVVLCRDSVKAVFEANRMGRHTAPPQHAVLER